MALNDRRTTPLSYKQSHNPFVLAHGRVPSSFMCLPTNSSKAQEDADILARDHQAVINALADVDFRRQHRFAAVDPAFKSLGVDAPQGILPDLAYLLLLGAASCLDRVIVHQRQKLMGGIVRTFAATGRTVPTPGAAWRADPATCFSMPSFQETVAQLPLTSMVSSSIPFRRGPP